MQLNNALEAHFGLLSAGLRGSDAVESVATPLSQLIHWLRYITYTHHVHALRWQQCNVRALISLDW